MSWRRMFLILWRLQLRRAFHRLDSGPARSGMLGLSILLLGFILLGLHLVMASSLDRLLEVDMMREALRRSVKGSHDVLRFTRYEDVPDASARLMLIFLQGTWLSALFLKWGHWQSPQRDAEWEWFAARPWPPWTLFVQRCLVESLWPQVFSIFIGSFFVLLALRRGLSLGPALAWSAFLVLMFQALLAAPRFTVDLWLRQRWPVARARALRGVSGIIGAGLLVLSIQALSVDQEWALTAVTQYGNILDRTPAGLALSALIVNGSAGLRYALILFALVVVVHAFAYFMAARLLRQPVFGLQSPGRSHGGFRRYPGLLIQLWQRLHPLTRRDLILLTRDRHFMLQMLVTPLILALAPHGLPTHDPAWMLVLAFGTGLLFLWTAVFQILPMEGQSLWMIFTWPQSLARYLWRRLRVLLTLAGCYAALVLVLGGLGWDTLELWRLPFLILGLLGFGLLLTALAVLAYRADSMDGGERPRLMLHYGMLIPGGLYGWIFLRPEVSLSVSGLLILGSTAGFVWWRMMQRLPRLLDPPVTRKKVLARTTLKLYLLSLRLVGLDTHAKSPSGLP